MLSFMLPWHPAGYTEVKLLSDCCARMWLQERLVSALIATVMSPQCWHTSKARSFPHHNPGLQFEEGTLQSSYCRVLVFKDLLSAVWEQHLEQI